MNPLSAPQQDTAIAVVPELTEKEYTSPLDTKTLEHSVNTAILESYIHYVSEYPIATIDIVEPTQKGGTTNICLQSVPITQVQHVVFFPNF